MHDNSYKQQKATKKRKQNQMHAHAFNDENTQNYTRVVFI